MKKMETYRGLVYPHNLDHMGHMNVMWYTSKFDEATWHFFGMMGISAEYLRMQKRGMFAVKQITEYKQEALAGDLIHIQSHLLQIFERKINFAHTMFNSTSNQVLATSEFIGVYTDLDTRKAKEFPDFILQKAREFQG